MIYNETIIMESDGDASIVMTISVGTTILDEMVICLEETVYDNDVLPDHKTMAILDKDNQSILAECLNIKPAVLKEHLIDKFSEGGYLSSTSYVRAVFQQILEYILDNGGKYRLKE